MLIKNEDIVIFKVVSKNKTYKFDQFIPAVRCSNELMLEDITHFINISASSKDGQSSISFSIAAYSKKDGMRSIRPEYIK